MREGWHQLGGMFALSGHSCGSLRFWSSRGLIRHIFTEVHDESFIVDQFFIKFQDVLLAYPCLDPSMGIHLLWYLDLILTFWLNFLEPWALIFLHLWTLETFRHFNSVVILGENISGRALVWNYLFFKCFLGKYVFLLVARNRSISESVGFFNADKSCLANHLSLILS